MPLTAGSLLGPYEIVATLGAGGTGEVHRARDTRLKRDVAVKVLPEAFAGDPDRLSRFQREAELLATLNHPNIAGIYVIEEADGVRAIVMELVEGETLAARLARPEGRALQDSCALQDSSRGRSSDRPESAAIPPDEALPLARQVAVALEAAHHKGVIHRDLKPANIKVTADGTVRVLATRNSPGFRPMATLFSSDRLLGFDVMPDGQQFVIASLDPPVTANRQITEPVTWSSIGPRS